MGAETASDAGTATAALLGPTSAGSQVALVLYGLYLALHARYYSTDAYRRLVSRVKVTLWVVFALLTAYTALLFIDSTYWTTTTKRAPSEIRDGWTVDAVLPLLAGCVQVPVQAVLALRAAVLITRRWVRNSFLGVLGLLILLSFTGAVLSCVSALLYNRGAISPLSPLDFNYSIALWLAASAVADIAISTTLASTLRQRIGAFDEQKDSLVRKVVIAGYQTMAYTTVLAVAGAVAACAVPGADSTFSFVDWAFWLPLPACYGLSLYTTLSIRRTPEHYLTTSTSSTLPVSSTLTSSSASTTKRKEKPSLAPVVVPISTVPLSSGEKSPLSGKPSHLHPHSGKGPRTSAIHDKIETWERRASVDVAPDEVRVPMPLAPGHLRRSSSFDSRVGLVGAPSGGPSGGGGGGRGGLRPEGEGEDGEGRRSRGVSPTRRGPEASVVDFGGQGQHRRQDSG
ncbi:hypothetical protein JCM6882_008411 [Rhodosporidiobolus microsporus]